MHRGADRQDGFTLVEVLVVVTVLGLIFVGLSQGVRVGLRGWDAQTRLINERDDLESTERLIRELVAEADPGAFKEPADFHGTQNAVSFATRLPLAAAGYGSRDVEVGLGTNNRNQLILRWVQHPHATHLASETPIHEHLLLKGVARLDFSYLQPSELGGDWVVSWSEATLPQTVRIRIVFLPGTPRHWPDIVTSPMRMQINHSATESRLRMNP